MSEQTIRHIRLANGLKLLCLANSVNPTVSVVLKIAAGGLDDTPDKFGCAGFAVSLLTKGTSKRSPSEIAETIDGLGMVLGASGGTHTCGLSARVLSENLKPAMELITEVLADPHPSNDEAEKMRQRILTGIKMKEDDPAAVATERMDRMIYGFEHPYGHSLSGNLETVPAITLEDIFAFYENGLRPGATVGVVVGDIDLNEIENIAASTLGKWDGGGSLDLQPAVPVDLPAEPKREKIDMPGKTQSDIALGFQGIRRLDPDYLALTVGTTVFGRLSLGGRIGQRIRDEEGLAYYAYAGFDAGIGAGPYMFRAGVNPANVDRSIELALEEMSKVKSAGITREEMQDAVVYLSGAMVRQVETNSGMASTMMAQEIYGLGDDYYLRFNDLLNELTLEEVNGALARHLHPDNYCLAIAGPGK